MKKLILGTAGHIDHGKTALVQALTGIDTDRLPEEKQRGITIDLGFANLQLGDLSFAIIDVPGHEGFIHNMLAGATGIDAVLLVVAADEGVMPQTREHVAILDLLDVRSGVIAITKSDLASEEWIQLVMDDIGELVKHTVLHAAPMVAVSAKSGAGLDTLRTAIVQQATRPQARAADDLFRLPIDRVFTVRGTGTVITGTVWSGTVGVDRAVDLRPACSSARIRGIQVHGRAVPSAQAGERAALALVGVDKEAVRRGDVATRGAWFDSRMLTAHVRLIPETAWSVKMRQRVRVHLGTAEVLARAVLLDTDLLGAGESGWVQLRLEQPVVARVGDRIVLRSYSPVTTIAGGIVAELSNHKRSRLGPAEAARLDLVMSGTPEQAVAAVLAQRMKGASLDELALMTPHSPAEVAAAVRALKGDVVQIGTRIFSRVVAESTIVAAVETVARLHSAHPLLPTLERAEVRAGMVGVAPELAEHALAAATQRGLLTAAGSTVAKTGFRPTLNDRQAGVREALLHSLQQAGLAPPTVVELSQSLGAREEIVQILRLLEKDGLIQLVAPDLYVDTSALRAALERTRTLLGGSELLPANAFRSALPVTRKHLIPLLEYFDRTGVTEREGDLRRVVVTAGNGWVAAKGGEGEGAEGRIKD
jgi:selenocysteine-specific elongation factor